MKPPITTAQAMQHPDVVTTINMLGQMADELRIQLAEVEKDALRYQHIRDNEDWMVIKGMRQSPYFMGAPLDRNVDADIAKEQA